MMNSANNPELLILDQAGIAFRGKVPAYVTSLVIGRYWKDEVGWWYLTEECVSIDNLSTWIASRDWFDEAFVLPPGSVLWLNINNHYVHYVKKTPLDDADWQAVTGDEMWLVERDRLGVHVTHYLLTEGEASASSASSNPTSPILLEWYKAQALRIYKDRVRGCSLNVEQRHTLFCHIADEVTPWDAEEPDVIAFLVAEHWLLNAPLPSLADVPTHRTVKTTSDLILQGIYLTLISALEASQEHEEHA